jgi:hypothetical protein
MIVSRSTDLFGVCTYVCMYMMQIDKIIMLLYSTLHQDCLSTAYSIDSHVFSGEEQEIEIRSQTYSIISLDIHIAYHNLTTITLMFLGHHSETYLHSPL